MHQTILLMCRNHQEASGFYPLIGYLNQTGNENLPLPLSHNNKSHTQPKRVSGYPL